ncbi:MAG: hypothetical protein JXR97_03930 [Planctomycetes bacterium]|nr:hypothetical protein [Planctomycetota bacterium]
MTTPDMKIEQSSFLSSRKSYFAVAFLGTAFLLIYFGLLCPGRLTEAFNHGGSGATTLQTAILVKNYDRPITGLNNYFCALFRDHDGTLKPKNRYISDLPYPYVVILGLTKIFGFSELFFRLLAITLTVACGLIIWRLLHRHSPHAACWAMLLYFTSPLTLIYGDMAYTSLIAGGFIAIILYSFHLQALGIKNTWRIMWVAGFLLTFSSPVYAPAVSGSIFLADLIWRRHLGTAIRSSLPAAVPWILIVGLHFTLLHFVGDLDAVSGRAGARGFLSAFAFTDNPFLRLGRAFSERLGIPILILVLVAAYIAMRKRSTEKPFLVTSAIILVTGYSLFFLQEMVAHRFMLQPFFPTFVLISAQCMAKTQSWNTGKRRLAAAALIIFCVGASAHRISRWEPVEKKAVCIRTASRLIQTKTAPQDNVLLLTYSPHYGKHLAVIYYSDRDTIMFPLTNWVNEECSLPEEPSFRAILLNIPARPDYKEILDRLQKDPKYQSFGVIYEEETEDHGHVIAIAKQ